MSVIDDTKEAVENIYDLNVSTENKILATLGIMALLLAGIQETLTVIGKSDE